MSNLTLVVQFTVNSTMFLLYNAVALCLAVLVHAQEKTTLPYYPALDIEDRLFNGRNATLGDFPYQCFMEITTGGASEPNIICGCVIISTEWVLTAGHCIYKIDAVTVSAGMIDVQKRFTPPAQRIAADKWSYHPDYQGPTTFTDDIALVHLSKPFTFSSVIKAALLPPKASAGYKWDNYPVFLSGWGNTGANGGWIEDVSRQFILKWRETTVMPYADCQRTIGQVPPKDICASKRIVNSGICQGDSGGPMAYRPDSTTYYVFGITSFLVGKCGDPYPGGFVSVNEYFDFISQVSGVNPPY